MPAFVQPDRREPESGCLPDEDAGEPVWVVGLAVLLAEQQVVVGVRRTDEQPLLRLFGASGPQCVDGAGVEGDLPTPASRLGVGSLGGAPVDIDQAAPQL